MSLLELLVAATNARYKEKITEQEEEIHDLENRVKVKNDVTNKQNEQLKELKLKNEAETVNIKKIHKAEVKSWRKNLGDEKRHRVKLERQLEEGNLEKNKIIEEKANKSFLKLHPVNLEAILHKNSTICSICSASIEKYQPKYYMGELIRLP